MKCLCNHLAPPPPPPSIHPSWLLSRPRRIRLSVAKVNETSIAPRENVSYSKETQTVIVDPVEKDGKWLFFSPIAPRHVPLFMVVLHT